MDIEIPVDIRQYSPKFLGAFSLRQVISIAVLISFFLIDKFIGEKILLLDHITYFPAMFLSVIPLAFAFGERVLGMPFELYCKCVFVSVRLTPRHRPYKTKNYYTELYPVPKINTAKQEKVDKDIGYELTAFK